MAMSISWSKIDMLLYKTTINLAIHGHNDKIYMAMYCMSNIDHRGWKQTNFIGTFKNTHHLIYLLFFKLQYNFRPMNLRGCNSKIVNTRTVYTPNGEGESIIKWHTFNHQSYRFPIHWLNYSIPIFCPDSNIMNVWVEYLHFSYNLHVFWGIHTSVYLTRNGNTKNVTTIAICIMKTSVFSRWLLEAVLQLTLTVVFKQLRLCNYCLTVSVWTPEQRFYSEIDALEP